MPKYPRTITNGRANVSGSNGIDPTKPHSTGSVAKLCNIAPRTVTKWCDKGLLKSYKIPLSLDRRILHEDLIEFVRDQGLPVPELTENIFGLCSKEWCEHLAFNYWTDNLFEAGFALATKLFKYYVLEDIYGYAEIQHIVNLIESKKRYSRIIILIDPSVTYTDTLNSVHLVKPVSPLTVIESLNKKVEYVARPYIQTNK